jgi:hypothetical protein
MRDARWLMLGSNGEIGRESRTAPGRRFARASRGRLSTLLRNAFALMGRLPGCFDQTVAALRSSVLILGQQADECAPNL